MPEISREKESRRSMKKVREVVRSLKRWWAALSKERRCGSGGWVW